MCMKAALNNKHTSMFCVRITLYYYPPYIKVLHIVCDSSHIVNIRMKYSFLPPIYSLPIRNSLLFHVIFIQVVLFFDGPILTYKLIYTFHYSFASNTGL